MKKILIVLSVIVLIGFLSSIYLSSSLYNGLEDTKSGLIYIVALWITYITYFYYRKKYPVSPTWKIRSIEVIGVIIIIIFISLLIQLIDNHGNQIIDSQYNQTPISDTLSQPDQNSQRDNTGDFNKKISCAELQSSVKNQVNNYNLSQQPKFSEAGTTYQAGTYLYHQIFYEVLYSPKVDSCVDIIISQTLKQTDSGYKVHEESYIFQDALSNRDLDYIDTIKHGSPYYTIDEVNKKISEYESI